MKIGETAQQVDDSGLIIRTDESIGLMPLAGRDSSGYRSKDEADLERIRLVVGARQLDISVGDMKEILAVHDKGHSPSPRILDLLGRQASEVEHGAFDWNPSSLSYVACDILRSSRAIWNLRAMASGNTKSSNSFAS